RALKDWLIRLVEIPGKRFRAAERTTAFLTRQVAVLADTARARLGRAESHRRQLRRQIETEKPRGKGGCGWLTPAPGGRTPAPRGAWPGYGRAWLQEVAEANAVVLLDAVQRELSEFLHDLGVGRQRVAQFADRFPPVDQPAGLQALPLPSGD